MINKDFSSIVELLQSFPDEQTCIKHLEELRWRGCVISPFDPTSKVYKCKNNQYKCVKTGKYFNVKTHTLFDSTKISLQKWFLAIWLVCGHKKGISSVQLAKDINVTQKTAWFMLHRIRKCFGIENNNDLDNDVELDETYVGGKNKNRHRNKKFKQSQGRSFKDKTPVLGMLERGGKVNAVVVDNVQSHTLTKEILKRVKRSARLHTDEWQGYSIVSRLYNHSMVRHNVGQYVDGNVYTNTIEGFWGILKRGIIGVYHQVTRKHLQKYLDEFVFRYNTRHYEESERFNLLISNTEVRTRYKDLIYG